jgi:hypothetical protein
MIETNSRVSHLAGIIPIAGQPLSFNMPWQDCLTPVHENYHAIERAVNTAATAGCNTIWIVMYRESAPLIRQKLGEWVYDPTSVWKNPWPVLQTKKIPVYYTCINAKDRKRRDSLAWSCLYGANVASRVCIKISKWVLPKRFLVISPYGIVPDDQMLESRLILRGKKETYFNSVDGSFKDNQFTPFTFSQETYKECKKYFKSLYEGEETKKTLSDIFQPVNLESYNKIDLKWYYNINDWSSYSKFIASEHNKLCARPKYMVTHKWYGFVDNIWNKNDAR